MDILLLAKYFLAFSFVFKAVTAINLPLSKYQEMVDLYMQARENRISQEVFISTNHLARRARANPEAYLRNILDQVNVETYRIADILFPTTHVTHRREQNHEVINQDEFINQVRTRLYISIFTDLKENLTKKQNALYTILEE